MGPMGPRGLGPIKQKSLSILRTPKLVPHPSTNALLRCKSHFLLFGVPVFVRQKHDIFRNHRFP